jgi:hypothetical protein
MIARIEAIKRAVHIDQSGATVETVSRFGKPVFEITLVESGRTAHDYLSIGSTYRKNDEGFALSRWGEIVAAALRIDRPPARVASGELIGKPVEVDLVQDDRGKEHVIAYHPTPRGGGRK